MAAADALGISHESLRQWDRKGFAVRCPRCRRVLLEPTRARIDAARDPGYAARMRSGREESLPAAGPDAPLPRRGLSDGETLVKARAARETIRAQLDKLKLDVAEGRLLARADVERVWYEEIRRARDRLLVSAPDIAAEAIGAGGDLRMVEEAVRMRIEAILSALAAEPVTAERGAGGAAAPEESAREVNESADPTEGGGL